MSLRDTSNATTRRVLLPAVIATLLLAACGPSPSISVQVGDATVEVVLGSSVTTDVTLTRAGGAAADVTLDADGAPDWVTVSFAPATLSGGTLSSTLTIETDGSDPAAEATSFTLTVTAVGTGLSASDELTVAVELLTVTGAVTDLFGQAITGVSVSVNGEAPVAVDAQGGFEWPDVAVPYDLTVFDVANEWAHVYEGLTTDDVTLMSPLGGPMTSQTTVSGDLSEVVGADQLGIVCIEGLGKAVTGCDEVPSGTTAYSLSATWYEGTTAEARLRAWVVDVDAGGATTGFARAGQTALNIEDGIAALADVTLGEGPDAMTVDVTVTPPPGIPLDGAALLYRYGEFGATLFPTVTPTEAYSAVLPDEPGATAILIALATGSDQTIYGWEVGEYASGAMDLVMPSGVTPIVPADAAVGVNHETEFRVNNPSGAAVSFLFSGTPSFIVTTNEPETTLPDLSGLGMPLPAAANYSWQAFVTPTLATVDDLAREGWISSFVDIQLLLAGGPGPASDGSLVIGSSRDFTTE